MARRERRKPEPGEYEDPLSIYEPAVYDDPFLQSLCEDAVTTIEHRPFLSVLADQTVRKTIAMMNDHDGAAVVVVDEQARPIGMFSERDVLERIADHFADVADRPVREYMTPDPVVVYATDPPAQVLNVMVSGGFRHVPIVDVDNKLVGVIGARRVTAYLKKYFAGMTGA